MTVPCVMPPSTVFPVEVLAFRFERKKKEISDVSFGDIALDIEHERMRLVRLREVKFHFYAFDRRDRG